MVKKQIVSLATFVNVFISSDKKNNKTLDPPASPPPAVVEGKQTQQTWTWWSNRFFKKIDFELNNSQFLLVAQTYYQAVKPFSNWQKYYPLFYLEWVKIFMERRFRRGSFFYSVFIAWIADTTKMFGECPHICWNCVWRGASQSQWPIFIRHNSPSWFAGGEKSWQYRSGFFQ